MPASEKQLQGTCLSSLEALLQDSHSVQEGLSCMSETLARSGNFRFLNSGEADIYSFATPLLVSGFLYREVRRRTARVMQAFEQLGATLRSNLEEARQRLLLRDSIDESFFQLDPGYQRICPIYRLDFVLPSQDPPQLLEVNCGCPGGELDPALVAEAFFQSPLVRRILDALSVDSEDETKDLYFEDPRDESLINLLKCYQAFRQAHPGFPESPTVALLTSAAQAHFMTPECRGIAEHYSNRGVRTLVGDILELDVAGDQVFLRGEAVHMVFRKFSTASFRLRMEDRDRFGEEICRRTRRIWDAVAHGGVCLVNPLGSTLLQDKGLIEYVRASFPELQDIIPETYVLRPDLPSENSALWDEICGGGSFILKRRKSFAGKHVILDPEVVKEQAPRILAEEPDQWVAQERVCPSRFPFAMWEGGRIQVGRFRFNVSLFGDSCFVRLGAKGEYQPLSAHSGGASTFALVSKG